MTCERFLSLAKILGHRDLSMVQRYAHLAPAHLKAVTNQAAATILQNRCHGLSRRRYKYLFSIAFLQKEREY